MIIPTEYRLGGVLHNGLWTRPVHFYEWTRLELTQISRQVCGSEGRRCCSRAVVSSLHHQHHVRVADEGRRVVAPPCPRSTARLRRSPIGRVESFRSWSSHLFRGRPGGRRHVRSGGRLSDTLMWSWRAMCAGVSSSSRATCPITEMHRRDFYLINSQLHKIQSGQEMGQWSQTGPL